jgi:hypothetical protein
MIGFDDAVRVWAYPAPCDMRKGFNGLSHLITWQLEKELTRGDCFLFLNRRQLGTVSTNCRIGTRRMTLSMRCAAVAVIRRPSQEGHSPRILQLNATRRSSLHDVQRTREKPWAKIPHFKY